ncbi:MAG: hypothetical protein U0790_00550 [Isosphaeraceae bacterium]
MEARARRIGRSLRRWLGPPRFWPAWALLATLLLVAFGPLAIDLLATIPWTIRKPIGHAAFLATVALGFARLLRVKPGDRWWADVPRPPDRADWAIPWALRLIGAAVAIPLFRDPDGLGYSDWDLYLEKFEAIRQTILVWHQFPWWTPWCRGGFPLTGNPQFGVVSVAMPFVLAFGTMAGLRMATACCAWLALEGAYRLARLWTGEPWSAAAAALIYGVSGPAISSFMGGYYIPMSYLFPPWLIYYAFRLGERRFDAVALGAWAGFGVANSTHYLLAYGFLIAGLAAIRAIRVGFDRPGIRWMAGQLLLASGVFFLACGWRLPSMFLVMRDFPHLIPGWPGWVDDLANSLLRRPNLAAFDAIPIPYQFVFFERNCYIGVLAAALAVGSLLQGWRWWHAMALICGWMAIGSDDWWHAGYWLQSWPVFASMHMVYRWRIPAMIGVGLAVAQPLAAWRRSTDPKRRWLAIACVLGLAADYLALGNELLPVAFQVEPEPDLFPEPNLYGEATLQLREGLGYPCQVRGYGLIQGYENLLGYRRDSPSIRKAVGEEGYRGEAWTDRGTIEPAEWSPNRVVYRVRPNEEVEINQNPGSWWLVNRVRIFADRRCAEPMQPFRARADDDGFLEIRIDPPTHRAEWVLEGLGLALMSAGLLLGRRRR